MSYITHSTFKKISGLVMAAVLIFGHPANSTAAIPQLVTYRGMLKNSSGTYLTGTYSMTFRLYAASTGGTALWSETQSGVSVSSGNFSAQLGSVTALNLDFTQGYWLSVQVGSDAEMSPRQRLTSVGYAYMAENVTNGFTQAQHDALTHKSIEGVRDNEVNIAKTNFKIDSYTAATANSMSSMYVDVLNDATGINAGASSNYTYRGSPNFDVTLTPTGGSVIQQSLTENDMTEVVSNVANSANGIGQQFKHSSAVTIDKVAFKWSRLGSPTAVVRFRIYSDSSGLPGTLLGETADINTANITSVYPTYDEAAYSLTAPVSLSANVTYHAVLEKISGTGDGSNHVNVKRSNGGNPYANGAAVAKSSSNVWASYAAPSDFYFKVYQQQTYSGSATVISNAFTESPAPAQAMIIPDETLNTGTITYYVSRDNGTTWTVCPKETVTTISAQPSGTQVKWKAVITGNAELNAIAVGL